MKRLLLVISITSITSYAMDDNQLLTDYNSVDGKPITAATIGSLIPAVPKDLQEKVDALLEQSADIVALATDIPNPLDFEAIKDNHRNRLQLQVNNSFSSMSKTNLVCDLDKDYIIKMSGMLHKVRSLLMSAQPNDKYHWDDLKDADYSAIDATKPTYQTISYAAHYYLLTKTIKDCNLTTVQSVDTYLAHRPSRSHTYTDDNYAVVQKRLPRNYVSLKDYADLEKKVIIAGFSDTMLEDQATAIDKAVLWDIASNIMIDPNDASKIHIVDLEQPNNSKSQLFFYQGKDGDWKRWWDTKTGFENMQNLYDKYGTEHQKEKWSLLMTTWKSREENSRHGS